MRLILTWRRWALIDVELLTMQRLDGDGDAELVGVDTDAIPFGFGNSED